MNKKNTIATPKHHAMLFSYIVKAARVELDSKADEIVKKAVKNYAMQRGRRMAKRVKKDGLELSTLNYLAYGEWEASPGDMDVEFKDNDEDINMVVHKCPWYDTWNSENILEYGEPYCKYVDEYLAKGYREYLVLAVDGTRTEGAEVCDFYFKDEALDDEDFEILAKRKEKLGSKAKKDWDYHIGHLLSAMEEVFTEELEDEGPKIIDKALELYQDKFGKEAYVRLMEYRDLDYESVDDYEGMDK
ncbi:MAG: L-2-amino-thiazoline-4-carboxylic acid hydrolase [Bacillota bacterium]|nr:L-2-amino-thiazoline-4-carboxylic acid hydrolase [Bacillota bacterium]